MSRELEFDGWWSGEVEYSCDMCGKAIRIPFDDEESAKNFKEQRAELRKQGWMMDKVNGTFRDFCSESCRNRYIRIQTL